MKSLVTSHFRLFHLSRMFFVHVRSEVMTTRKLEAAKLAPMRYIFVNTFFVASKRGSIEESLAWVMFGGEGNVMI